MIIDIHTHAFPRFGTDSEGQTARTQLQIIQHHTQFHVQGWRRRRDGESADCWRPSTTWTGPPMVC